MAPIIERALAMPAARAAGIACVALAAGHSQWQMDVPDWMVDTDGSVPAGSLGILADTSLTSACVAAVADRQSVVTSHLQFELLAPLRTRTLVCTALTTALGDGWALSAGEVETGDGTVVARISMGAVLFEQPRAQGPAATGSDLDARVLGMVSTSAGNAVTTCTPAYAWLANAYGGLHGGAGFLIGERTLQLAMGPTMRALEVHAVYLRPIPADGQLVESVATVAHRGRRLAAARGEVNAPSGKPAVLVDATYIPDGR